MQLKAFYCFYWTYFTPFAKAYYCWLWTSKCYLGGITDSFSGAFFQNWVSITDGHRATCVITIKMQLGVQRASCNLHPCGVHERRLWKLSLFWGPNMLKQPVYDVLLGLISPQIPQIPCFLIFEEKYFKNSLQGWAFFTV